MPRDDILLLILLALSLLFAGYLAYALTVARRAAQGRPAFDSLLGGLREFVTREVSGARSESQHARERIREAAAQLRAGLDALAEDSRQQAGLIEGLVAQESVDRPGILGFAQEARGLVAGLTHALNTGSRESVKSVQAIDQMARQLDEIFALLAELEGLAGQTAKLAGDAAAHSTDAGTNAQGTLALVADEVRHLAERSGDFNGRMRALVSDAKHVVAGVRERIEAAAERAMNASIEAKTRADALADQASAINRALALGVREASDNSQRMGQGVSAAAQALKFEEAAVQALATIEGHLERLASVNTEAAQLRQTLDDPAQSALLRERALERFGRQLRRL